MFVAGFKTTKGQWEREREGGAGDVQRDRAIEIQLYVEEYYWEHKKNMCWQQNERFTLFDYNRQQFENFFFFYEVSNFDMFSHW